MMNNFLILILIALIFPLKSYAKKRDVELEIKVMLDGKTPIAFGHIYVTNLISKTMTMPNVDVIGVKSTDKNGKLTYKINNLNGKGVLHIKLLSDYCEWYARSYTIDLNENKGKIFHVVLNAEPENCTR